MSHKAFSNQDIQDLFLRDKSMQDENNTQSDKIIDDDFLYKPNKISEGGSASPYVP